MIIHVVTIFPEFFRGPLDHGVVARALGKDGFEIRIHNLRDWTGDRQKTVDDRPFGGGEGMVMKPGPLFDAVESIVPKREASVTRVVLLSAQGARFDQRAARRLTEYREIVLICGRYEGVDERVAENLADEELSIGDYVLSGGELAACVVMDVVGRLQPGVLGNEDSASFESFEAAGHGSGALDCPQYTRPAEFRGWKVPGDLLSGNHEKIRRWRRDAAMEKTARMRPDLFETAGRKD